MKKRIVVEKDKFDAALDRLIKTPALAMKDVKTDKKKPAKLIPPQST